nr:helix-turn-helix domain-containing protein [Desulfoprunum benzoelyticum]
MVLICIIKYAGKANQAWPGIKTLAKNSGMSERHVRRTIRQLEDLDLLRTETRPGHSSLYHIPEFTLQEKQLTGTWYHIQGADHQSAPPGPAVRTPRTTSPPTPDCQSAEYYQRTLSKNISLSVPFSDNGTVHHNNEKPERDFYDQELIEAWQEQFSTSHHPETPKEQQAMDWMLFAAKNNQLSAIQSPLAYLRTITRNGHPLNYPPFRERQVSKCSRIARSPPSPLERWKLINQVHRTMYILEAKESGVQEHELEEKAFHIFAAEYEKELGGQKIALSCNAP